jgi:uncharacterized damage-inducible protein DinB
MNVSEHLPEKLSSSAVARINDLLLQELEKEIQKTRTTLERVPAEKKEFAPHPKSTALGRLASHVAQLAEFGTTVLTEPGLDFGSASFVPVQFESAEQLAQIFDEGARKLRNALKTVPDAARMEPWKLSFRGRPIFQGSRFLAYREMFLNHLIHHRAQLGVYLRLTGNQVPATYGPSADEGM